MAWEVGHLAACLTLRLEAPVCWSTLPLSPLQCPTLTMAFCTCLICKTWSSFVLVNSENQSFGLPSFWGQGLSHPDSGQQMQTVNVSKLASWIPEAGHLLETAAVWIFGTFCISGGSAPLALGLHGPGLH
jgi:hypothetical protein